MPIDVLGGPRIAAGESLSDAVDCRAGSIIRIDFPDDWSEAPLTLQTSSDGTKYRDLFGGDGFEISIAVVKGAAYVLPTAWGRIAGYVKFRSGSRASPVLQKAARVFQVVLEKST